MNEHLSPPTATDVKGPWQLSLIPPGTPLQGDQTKVRSLVHGARGREGLLKGAIYVVICFLPSSDHTQDRSRGRTNREIWGRHCLQLGYSSGRHHCHALRAERFRSWLPKAESTRRWSTVFANSALAYPDILPRIFGNQRKG